MQQVDSGTKMIHLGKEHHLADHLQGHLRRAASREHLSRPRLGPPARRRGARNFPRTATRCSSANKVAARTRCPYIESKNASAVVRARRRPPPRSPRTSCSTARSAGPPPRRKATALIVNGFVQGRDPEAADGVRGSRGARSLIANSLAGRLGGLTALPRSVAGPGRGPSARGMVPFAALPPGGYQVN